MLFSFKLYTINLFRISINKIFKFIRREFLIFIYNFDKIIIFKYLHNFLYTIKFILNF